MKELIGHQANEQDNALSITAHGEPSNGGAYHDYVISNSATHDTLAVIHFQEGGIKQVGVNGVSEAALLEIVADRLRGFQAGPYGDRNNSIAITKIEEALHRIHDRTRERQRRQVEGTQQA